MMQYKKTAGDRAFDLLIAFFILFVAAITLYPLIYVISMAISDPLRAARGEVFLLPKGFSLEAIQTVLSDSKVVTY